MGQVISLENLIKIIPELKKTKKVGIISGCFDILHIGHAELFEFAKNNVDVVVVGVESDITIKKSKGNNRPINSQEHRAKLLSMFLTIDYIICLENNYDFGTDEADKYYNNLIESIRPHYIITSVPSDPYYKKKEIRAKKNGAKLLTYKTTTNTSTTNTIKDLIEVAI